MNSTLPSTLSCLTKSKSAWTSTLTHLDRYVPHLDSPCLYMVPKYNVIYLFEEVCSVCSKGRTTVVIHVFCSLFYSQVMVTEQNTMFIENVIFIMKNILENKQEQPCEHLGITSIESLMLTVVRYVVLPHITIILFSQYIQLS